ncbi:hypothetical protein GCM10027416_11930 [Okibacterium endophyticum]
MFGLTFDKLVIIGVIAVFLLGPERLPHYAAQLARLVRSLREMARGAKDRMRDEMGPEFDEVDWQKLDPRQYDPRRIIKEALLDDTGPEASKPRSAESGTGAAHRAGVADRVSRGDEAAAPAGVGAGGAGAGGSGSGRSGDGGAGASAGWVERIRGLRAGEQVPPPYDAEAT